MGQGESMQLARDTVVAEQSLRAGEARHGVTHRAWRMCVAPTSRGADDGYDLTPEERTCVEEYALLYAGYAHRSQAQFATLYDTHQRDLITKAQLEYMRQQARHEGQRV